MLSFELTNDKIIEIFFDEAGRNLLATALSRIQSPGDHEHLMTETWGGVGLSGHAHSAANELIHMVTIGMPHQPT